DGALLSFAKNLFLQTVGTASRPLFRRKAGAKVDVSLFPRKYFPRFFAQFSRRLRRRADYPTVRRVLNKVIEEISLGRIVQ
ncbi:MAG: hypothetical protein J6Y82_07770, partial [Bacteroidales bacterium]|nr:hypothetical protein [Bacteroidales bacterium]